MDKLDDKNVDTTGLSDEERAMLMQYHKLIDQDLMFAHDDKKMLTNIAALAMPDIASFADDEKLSILRVGKKSIECKLKSSP